MAWDDKRRTPADYLHPKKQQRILDQHGRICRTMVGPDGRTYGCGHGDAEQVDHTIPWAEWNNPHLSVHDPSNLAPMHGEPCPTCGRQCHEDKSKAEAARGRARSNAKRKAQGVRPAEKHPGSLT
jgi:hypothetical protein